MNIKGTATCSACGTSTPYDAPPQYLTVLTIYHEDDCPFLLAVNIGVGVEWIKDNGYPIRYE